jgi:hypothetical protein
MRKSCAENTVNALLETLIRNQTVFINNGKDNMIEFYLNDCLEKEKEYEDLIL